LKTLKQYRCHRCDEIFKTYRRYTRSKGKKTCDNCLKGRFNPKYNKEKHGVDL